MAWAEESLQAFDFWVTQVYRPLIFGKLGRAKLKSIDNIKYMPHRSSKNHFDYLKGLFSTRPEIILAFGSNAVELLEASFFDLKTAYVEQRVGDLARHAHTLKGILAYWGAKPIYDLAMQIEFSAKAQEFEALSVRLKTMNVEAENFYKSSKNMSEQQANKQVLFSY